jgi:HSP20 family protein
LGSFRLSPMLRRDLWPRVGEFGRAVWSPEVEVFERDGQFTVRADLPGVAKDGVKVEIVEGALVISGERKEEKEEKGEGFYRTERTYGSFFRRVPLPEGVKADEASATFKNGVLEVAMPAPKREPQGRTLEIKEPTDGPAEAKAVAK